MTTDSHVLLYCNHSSVTHKASKQSIISQHNCKSDKRTHTGQMQKLQRASCIESDKYYCCVHCVVKYFRFLPPVVEVARAISATSRCHPALFEPGSVFIMGEALSVLCSCFLACVIGPTVTDFEFCFPLASLAECRLCSLPFSMYCLGCCE